MNSLDENCTPDKRRYDDCFNSWFRSVFLKGKTTPDHDAACGELFAQYQTCLQKILKEKNLDNPELFQNILGTDREKPTPS